MRVLVAGGRGLVGQELCPILAKRNHHYLHGDLPECDVTNPNSLAEWSGDFEADWVVNLAAYTHVDDCERNPLISFLANSLGPRHVASMAIAKHARLLQVSTDYVFDGLLSEPRTENSDAFPLSVYGATKLAGEWAARSVLPAEQLLIVRGQSLFGRGRKSFPDSILERAETASVIPVVVDQVVSPTWARDFAEGLVHLMERGAWGIVHLSSSGHCSWNEFAHAVLEEAGNKSARIAETTAGALARPAQRPAFSVFDLSRFKTLVPDLKIRTWRDQLHDYLRSTSRTA